MPVHSLNECRLRHLFYTTFVMMTAGKSALQKKNARSWGFLGVAMILTHATGAKEKQMILAVVPRYYQTPICIHSYEFALRVFSDEWVVMQPCTLCAHHASITRNHVRIQSYTLFPRVKSMTNLEHLVPSARHRFLLAGLGSRSVINCWFSNKYWWASIAFSFSTWFPVQSIIKLDWVMEGDVTP